VLLDLVQPWNFEFANKSKQIDCILFSRAATGFGIRQQKQLEYCLSSSRAENNFGICQQTHLKLTVF
jgi:hypothetical protein